MKKIADEGHCVARECPVLEFLAGEGELSRRMGAWLDAHPYVALAILMAAMLAASTADSWF